MKFALSALMTSIALSTPAWAQQKADEHAGHHAASGPTATADEMTDAEIEGQVTCAVDTFLRAYRPD